MLNVLLSKRQLLRYPAMIISSHSFARVFSGGDTNAKGGVGGLRLRLRVKQLEDEGKGRRGEI